MEKGAGIREASARRGCRPSSPETLKPGIRVWYWVGEANDGSDGAAAKPPGTPNRRRTSGCRAVQGFGYDSVGRFRLQGLGLLCPDVQESGLRVAGEISGWQEIFP